MRCGVPRCVPCFQIDLDRLSCYRDGGFDVDNVDHSNLGLLVMVVMIMALVMIMLMFRLMTMMMIFLTWLGLAVDREG